ERSRADHPALLAVRRGARLVGVRGGPVPRRRLRHVADPRARHRPRRLRAVQPGVPRRLAPRAAPRRGRRPRRDELARRHRGWGDDDRHHVLHLRRRRSGDRRRRLLARALRPARRASAGGRALL
ncbi:MAG: hypothetical protein AVDCRST_MAG06-86, partial [uncultured Nocardioides sp.]